MENKNLKKMFGDVARSNNFEELFGGWFKESVECINVLSLQKSNFGNYFDLNIKVYIQGIFGKRYIKSGDLVKNDTGDVFIRLPNKYKDALDMTIPFEYSKRKIELEFIFEDFIIPFSIKALTKSGLQELEAQNSIFLLPAIKGELT